MLLTLQHLAHAPRAQKEAAALAAAGAQVTVLGSWWDRTKAAEDEHLARAGGFTFVPLVTLFQGTRGATLVRLRARLARELYRRWRIVRPEAYGLTARLLLQSAHDLKPDLVMVHCEPGLWAGRELHRRGFRVGIDFEDWFSADLLPEARAERPVAALAEAENYLLRHAAVRFAPTRAMAEALARNAGVPTIPLRIPNCFPWSDAPATGRTSGDARGAATLSLYWFSQTIGPGRGLESLASALALVRGPWELHLRGDIHAHRAWFEATFPAALRERIHIHPPASNHDLPILSAAHDVGLALEIPFCPSRDLTATNKIFEYLRCGLAVVATATTGQREVMRECPAAGWLVPPGDSAALASTIQSCLDRPDMVRDAREAARQAARDAWAWERFRPDLVQAVTTALPRN